MTSEPVTPDTASNGPPSSVPPSRSSTIGVDSELQARFDRAKSSVTNRRAAPTPPQVSTIISPMLPKVQAAPESRPLRPCGGKFGHTAAPNIPRRIEDIEVNLRAKLFDVVSGPVTGWPLVLIGPAGVGKTCAALVMYDRFGGWFAELPSFHARLNEVRTGSVYWDGPNGCQVSVGDFWSSWERATLCVMDEIGLRSPSDSQYETLKMAMDRREDLPTIYISNLGLPALERVYDDRIVSRLAAGTIYQFNGPDRRLRKET